LHIGRIRDVHWKDQGLIPVRINHDVDQAAYLRLLSSRSFQEQSLRVAIGTYTGSRGLKSSVYSRNSMWMVPSLCHYSQSATHLHLWAEKWLKRAGGSGAGLYGIFSGYTCDTACQIDNLKLTHT
jgi:hypothetical protein